MRKTLTLSACLLMLGGCASLHQPSAANTAQAASQKAPAPQAQQKKKPTVYGNFPPDVLDGLMTAEIALQRGHYQLALSNYLQAARQTDDLGIIHRGLFIAQKLNANTVALELAQLWIKAQPKSIDARQVAALNEIVMEHFDKAQNYLEQILQLGGDADFDGLASVAQNLPGKSQKQLIGLYENMLKTHPDNLELRYGLALLYRFSGDKDQSMKHVKALLDKHPDYEPAMLLYGTLLYDTGDKDKALSYLRRESRRYPDNRKLGTLYARMLIEKNKLQEAEDEFHRLAVRFPQHPELKLSHALVALKNGHRKIARQELKELTGDRQVANEAHYYLGRMYEYDKKNSEAIQQYDQVRRGAHFFAALAHASYLKAKEGRLQDALDDFDTLRQQMPNNANELWLLEINLLRDLNKHQQALKIADQALEKNPDSIPLRYARAMTYDALHQVDNAEKDLRAIIKDDPNNSVALNALGYMLTVTSTHYQEAFKLIDKAYKLDPNNPAIIDSLGWINYKMGHLQKALGYLKKAYANYPDPEVAAHLGIVLYKTGDKASAIKLFRKTLKDHPKNAAVLKAVKDLGIDLNE